MATLSEIQATILAQYPDVEYQSPEQHPDFPNIYRQYWAAKDAGGLVRGLILITDYQGAGEMAECELRQPLGTLREDLLAWLVNPARPWQAVLNVGRINHETRTVLITAATAIDTDTASLDHHIVFQNLGNFFSRKITNVTPNLG